MTTATAKRTKPNQLTAIAAEMRALITDAGASYAHRRLAHGLELVLLRRGQQWRLALGRPGVRPSEQEVAVCMEAFGVAPDTEWHYDQKYKTGKLRNQGVVYHLAEMFWTEVEVG